MIPPSRKRAYQPSPTEERRQGPGEAVERARKEGTLGDRGPGDALGALGLGGFDRLPLRLEAVSMDDVTRALKRIDPAKLALVVVGDRSALEREGASFPVPEKKEPD